MLNRIITKVKGTPALTKPTVSQSVRSKDLVPLGYNMDFECNNETQSINNIYKGKIKNIPENKNLNIVEKVKNPPLFIDINAKYWYDEILKKGNEKTKRFAENIVDHVCGNELKRDGMIMSALKKITKELVHRFLVLIMKIVIAYELGKMLPKCFELGLIKYYVGKNSI